MNDWKNAAWQTIPAYHLTEEIVNEFLQSIFGYYDFFTSVSSQLTRLSSCLRFEQLQRDNYMFWIPRPLEKVRLG